MPRAHGEGVVIRHLHLVDGTYELFRAHYSRRPSRTDGRGRDVKATVGVLSSLLALMHDPDEDVTHLAVAFDHPIESFRNRLFPSYKDGSGVDPSLRAQFTRVEDAVRALGVVVWPMDEFEADDALATAAHQHAGVVGQIRICTPDKDLGQVVSGRAVVQVDRARGRTLDEEAVIDRMGVPPAVIPDLLALVGDSADGIPGITGFGMKTAALLLRRYGGIEDIPSDPAAWEVEVRGARRLAERLAAERDTALLYRRLATLVTDVPLPEDLSQLEWRGAPWADLERVAADLDAPRVLERVGRWA